MKRIIQMTDTRIMSLTLALFFETIEERGNAMQCVILFFSNNHNSLDSNNTSYNNIFRSLLLRARVSMYVRLRQNFVGIHASD